MAQDNQFGFYRDVQLNNGALVVTGITGGGGSGTSGTSGAAGTSGTNGTSGTSGGGGSSTPLPGIHFNTDQVSNQLGLIGLTTIYGQVALTSFGNRVMCYPVIPAQDTDISYLVVDQGGTGSGGEAKLVIYNNLNNYPNTLIRESATIDLFMGGGCCRIHNAAITPITLSAGTQYWIGIALNDSNMSSISLYSYDVGGLMSIGRPNTTDGTGVQWKIAVSAVYSSWPTVPSTFVSGGNGAFYGGAVIEGFYGQGNPLPAVFVKFT